ncbi:hypothetical protein GNF10_08580 [Nostoc sp. UCD121]|uniref:hypothetical protein n=1 Tax=unclassified Nostoc TaxID=2593658 RepID=UPI0016288C0A|nr:MULTISPECIES: hypothetical protein [unclassified Nostoc]MBC1218579.1 hypothetical protein [Nostoc sp. UCD120]MBC1276044.1 hypothetical protein [Nostoc sp. UCD121]MBC1295322.1 hypothetical protein [Nostoc sp. UCD122]
MVTNYHPILTIVAHEIVILSKSDLLSRFLSKNLIALYLKYQERSQRCVTRLGTSVSAA